MGSYILQLHAKRGTTVVMSNVARTEIIMRQWWQRLTQKVVLFVHHAHICSGCTRYRSRIHRLQRCCFRLCGLLLPISSMLESKLNRNDFNNIIIDIIWPPHCTFVHILVCTFGLGLFSMFWAPQFQLQWVQKQNNVFRRQNYKKCLTNIHRSLSHSNIHCG